MASLVLWASFARCLPAEIAAGSEADSASAQSNGTADAAAAGAAANGGTEVN